MAFTVEQYEALKAAIAQGVLKVDYQDKSVTYRSLDEMIRVLRLIEEELGLRVRGARKYAEAGKGLE